MRLAWAGTRVSPLVTALMALAAVALVSSCSGPGGGASGGASGGGSITVAAVPGIGNAPARVAVQDGLFRQRGLDVTVRDYQSLDEELQALASGQAQVATGDYTSFLYEQATGRASLRLVADGYDAAPDSLAILTLPGSGITTPQQLEDQPVATPPAQAIPYSTAVPYNMETLAAEEVLQNDGVSPSSVHWTPMSPQDMIGALRGGRVKAILTTEPYILEAEKQVGAVEVLDASSGVTSGLPMSGYFTLSSYARANPSAVRAFREALREAQADCAQRGPVQATLPHLTGMSTVDAALVTLGTYPTSLDVGQVQRLASLMYDSGMIHDPVNVSTLASG